MTIKHAVLPVPETLKTQLAEMAKAVRGGADTVPLLPLLREAGALSLLSAKAQSDVDWKNFSKVARQLAAIYPVAGWLVATCNINAVLAARMQTDAEAAPIVVASGSSADAELKVAGERVTITGSWKNILAVRGADYLLASLEWSGKPAVALLPVDKLKVTEVAARSLCGPGLYNVEAAGVEIAATAVALIEELFAARNGAERGLANIALAEFYRGARLSALVGAAEGAYSEYVAITTNWVSSIGGQQIAKFTQVQVRLAETSADLAAVGLMLGQSNRVLRKCLREGVAPTELQLRILRRNNAYVARQALDAIGRLVVQMGARGLMASNPVQHYFLDLRAMAAHSSMDWIDNMSLVGKGVLGLEPDHEDAPQALFVGG